MKPYIAIRFAAALTCCLMVSTVAAQTGSPDGPRPRYVILPSHAQAGIVPNVSIPLWNGSYSYGGHTYTYSMVGTDPATNASTTVPVVIIPVKIVLSTGAVFSPGHVLSNGNTVTQNTVLSPLFDSSTDYVQGGVDVGATQYTDAFQRANFWGTVSSNSNYHVLLGGPTVMPVQTLRPPKSAARAATVFGVRAGLVNLSWFDPKIQGLMSTLGIQPNTLPIFLTYNVYLTEGPPSINYCCVGGYHNFTGSQTYMHATYMGTPGVFSQDVSALSHEIGEWVDDPLVNNIVYPACSTPGSLLEDGDPLEGDANYGAYPYTVNGFTYHLQDLVTLPYFGAPTSTSVNGQFTFQGTSLAVCQNGQ